MLNPKYQSYVKRIHDLIEEGNIVARLEKTHGSFIYIGGSDGVKLQSWLTKSRNMLETVFGTNSPHYRQFLETIPVEGVRKITRPDEVYQITGILSGALDDLENGFLVGQEFLIAGAIFDGVLDQAKQLNKNGYKDPAAVLARVVLEDSLKRIAREEMIDDKLKASVINDELKKKERYSQPQWRFIQAWLDIGNSAAHGNFSDYIKDDVLNMIQGIEQFIIAEFHE
jgi:hypothetical protein